MIPKLTRNLLRAGRALAGFTRDDLADRAGLSRVYGHDGPGLHRLQAIVEKLSYTGRRGETN